MKARSTDADQITYEYIEELPMTVQTALAKAARYIGDQPIERIVYVPGKVVNIVLEPQ